MNVDGEDLVVEETHVRVMIALAKYPAGSRSLHIAQAEFVHPTDEIVLPWLRDLERIHLAELVGDDRWHLTFAGLRFLEAVDR
jgi:hypothetical protein